MAARPLASQHVAGAEQRARPRGSTMRFARSDWWRVLGGRLPGSVWPGPIQPWFLTQSPYNERFKAFGSGS